MGKTAYSYVRFSSKEQAKGASLLRQLEKSRAYASDHGLSLDESMRDEGISAYRGRNAKEGHLARFLALIRAGTIKPGCVLIVESLDRLSRQTPSKALTQFLEVINAGVSIVTLTDGQVYSSDSIDQSTMQLFGSIMVMVRAHEESATKGKRIADAWARKRAKAKQGTRMTQKLPYWVDYNPDRTGYQLIPERAATIRRIFKMFIEGRGSGSIEKILNAEKVSPFENKSWAKSYIQHIIKSRMVLGEYQPMTGGEKDGPAISDYYPPVIEEKTFLAAQAARDVRRKDNGGYMSYKHSNLFSHFTFCGLCGEKIRYVAKDKKRNWVYMTCANSRNGVGCKCKGWKYSNFERTVLRWIVLPHSGETVDTGKLEELNTARLAAQAKADELERKVVNLMDSIGMTDNAKMRAALLTQAEANQREEEEARKAALDAQNALSLEEEKQASLRSGTKSLEQLIADAATPENRIKLREEIRRRVGKIIMFSDFLRVGPSAERYIDLRSESAAVLPINGKRTRVIMPAK